MERNSSVEWYRIIATFAVLVFHFNGWLVGGMPKHFDVDHISTFRISQAIIESCSCICVNMFLVISGYFGIHFKWQSVLKIYLLLFFVHIPFYLIDCLLFNNTLTIKELVSKFLVISNGGYFVQCYIFLMLLSPIINSFMERFDRKKGLYLVLGLVFFEFWFDCITHTEYFGFRCGYSVQHFIIVYMLARYIQYYKDELIKYKCWFWIGGYLLCTFIILLMYVYDVNYVWQYSNPIIIISAVCSFVPFLYRCYVNRWVNWVAKSTLAVYIIHVTVPVYNIVVYYDTYILKHYQYSVYLVLAMVGVICVFVFCVIYDKLRLLLTDPIYNCIISLGNRK